MPVTRWGTMSVQAAHPVGGSDGRMIERIIQESVGGREAIPHDWVPADNIGRDAWQAVAEDVVERVRLLTRRPAFGLSEADVSVHYHKPVCSFGELILARLGITSL